jgi:hypothetical protein
VMPPLTRILASMPAPWQRHLSEVRWVPTWTSSLLY